MIEEGKESVTIKGLFVLKKMHNEWTHFTFNKKTCRRKIVQIDSGRGSNIATSR
jgi:hypothetical protein